MYTQWGGGNHDEETLEAMADKTHLETYGSGEILQWGYVTEGLFGNISFHLFTEGQKTGSLANIHSQCWGHHQWHDSLWLFSKPL